MSQYDSNHHDHHIVPIPVYLAIFVALLVLTGVTIWVAFLDLGAWDFLHTPLALAIASIKAVLVVLWFMHVKYTVRLTWVFIAAGMLWLLILIAITLADYVGQSWEYQSEGWRAADRVVETVERRV